MIPTVIKLEDNNYKLLISSQQLDEIRTKPSELCDILNQYEHFKIIGYDMGTINNGGQHIENAQSEEIIAIEIENTSTTDDMFDNYILAIIRKILLELYKNM